MSEEETITFEYIREAQRKEQRESGLSKIPDDFYDKAKTYLEQKKELAKKKRDKSTSLEASNVEMLLEDVFNRRETKLINQAIISARTGIIPTNLIESEKEFFETIVEVFKKQRDVMLEKLFSKKKNTKLEEVKFLEDVPTFVGIDLKKYGPYHKGDTTFVPMENAKLLEKTSKVKRID